MEIILAGYNLDYETIQNVRKALPELGEPTPETIAAAYARISRNSRPVNELRSLARAEVDKARQSNRNIVFEMGHSSIAEHVVFNIDVLGVSRLLVEEIEKFRLCSYTEKSQRYVLLQDDFVIPEEIRHAGLEKRFVAMVREQNHFYHDLYAKLRPHVFEQHPDLAADPKNRSLLEGWAKEDARYIIALATETQLGITLNARNLELMLRRLAAHPLAEAGLYSCKLYDATKNIAPSLIRYTDATDYDRLTRQALKEKAASLTADKRMPEQEPVVLYATTPHADEKILAALIHSSSRLSMAQCLEIVDRMDAQDKENLVRTAFRHLRAYDPVLREFEQADLHFELVVSAGCFAQLKRHRMATLTAQDYDPALGATIPPAVSAIGMDKAFLEILTKSEAVYEQIRAKAPAAAPYILTNAHRKRVSLKVNARELYHMARLRADRHAQWDIRAVTVRMLELAKAAMPLTLMLAAGKDGFESLYRDVFP
ncbi:MAG: FAD-dependent thymidylate synthase [Pseudomonadota bacterium]